MAIRIALHDTSRHVTGDPRLRQVILNIEEHPGQSISVTKLAALAGLSEAQLRRIFHAELHTSPKRYLMHVRMNYARNLIRSEGLRVQEAADTLGFPSAFQFSAQYRKIHGVSPSHDLK
jgi:transcriptional regulator GlxA family with amidase domain